MRRSKSFGVENKTAPLVSGLSRKERLAMMGVRWIGRKSILGILMSKRRNGRILAHMAQFSLRRPGGVLALAGGFISLAVLLAAQAPAPPAKEVESLIPKLVVQAVEDEHLAHPRINGDLAQEWCKNYVETLDPQKVYFYKKDVEEFLAACADG